MIVLFKEELILNNPSLLLSTICVSDCGIYSASPHKAWPAMLYSERCNNVPRPNNQ